MSRVAIIGSCITRDLWPILGVDAGNLLYVSRTSLASLFADPIEAVRTTSEPPPALKRHQHNAVVADLKKTALQTLVAYQPSHIIFDFIDERFDLLAQGSKVANHSWELEVSGYLEQLSPNPRRIARLSGACDLLWSNGLSELTGFIAATPLKHAQLILHRAQWAKSYRGPSGRARPFGDLLEIMPGQQASRAAHNQMLARYEAEFLARLPDSRQVSAPKHRTADPDHRWGLSPFHYVESYYQEIWTQLRDLGIKA